MVTASECQLKLLQYAENTHFAFLDNVKYRMTCIFYSTCRRPYLTYEFNPLANDNAFRYVFSDYYRVVKRLSYQQELSVSGNEYSITLIINPFRPGYGGDYRCGIRDLDNPSRRVRKRFRVYGK